MSRRRRRVPAVRVVWRKNVREPSARSAACGHFAARSGRRAHVTGRTNPVTLMPSVRSIRRNRSVCPIRATARRREDGCTGRSHAGVRTRRRSGHLLRRTLHWSMSRRTVDTVMAERACVVQDAFDQERREERRAPAGAAHMVDLTTLEGKDSPEKVPERCAARRCARLQQYRVAPPVAAVCVYRP